MIGVAQTGINEGNGRAGIMIPVPGFSMYQARLLQHNSHQVNVVNYGKVGEHRVGFVCYGMVWHDVMMWCSMV